MDRTDPVALVTGASSGIGAATARTLAEAGYAVALAARREERLREVADEIDSDRTLVVPTDVTDEAAATETIEETIDAFGRLDVLVNNAGIGGRATVREARIDELHEPVEVNLLGAMNVTHAALPHLLEADGDVVTVSSMNARYPADSASGYTASKFGVNGFCRSLRKELAEEDVRVTIVMPGPVITELNDWADWDGRALDPEDVAEAVVFAVSRPAHVELPEITVNSTDKL